MICNIIDRREKPYRWRKINAVIEATCDDNVCEDSDQATEGESIYEQRAYISLNDAVQWANSQPLPVTLYLYNGGEGF